MIKLLPRYEGKSCSRPALRLLSQISASDAGQACLDDQFHVIVATPCSCHHLYPCLQMKIVGHPVDGPSFFLMFHLPGFVVDQLLMNSW